MRIRGEPWRSIFVGDDGWTVDVIDQTILPFSLEVCHLRTVDDAARAIRDMIVRGAPLIGVTAAYGVALAMRDSTSDVSLDSALEQLENTRPTAVNLRWALARMGRILHREPPSQRVERAYAEAGRIAEEDVAACADIGRHGAQIIERLGAGAGGRPVSVLTHCNAGWLACVDWGTALAPIYAAHDSGSKGTCCVDETRPRNQGASLTAFGTGRAGILARGHRRQCGWAPDAAGQGGLWCIVGSDRTTRNRRRGEQDRHLPEGAGGARQRGSVLCGPPSSTIDWSIADGLIEVPIEQRSAREVTHVRGRADDGQVIEVEVVNPGSTVCNPGFDVTPARLVTGIITERGIASASAEGLLSMYPERSGTAT